MTARPQQQIELLPREEWEKSSFGKFLKWALNAGRYVVIGTELIVIAAFLSRFKLDHDLTNLYEEIKQKQAIVEANREFEKEFRFLQTRLKIAGDLQKGLRRQSDRMDQLAAEVPIDVTIKEINIQEDGIDFTAKALSEQGLASFLVNLQKMENLENLTLSETSTDNKQEIGIHIAMNAQVAGESNKKAD